MSHGSSQSRRRDQLLLPKLPLQLVSATIRAAIKVIFRLTQTSQQENVMEKRLMKRDDSIKKNVAIFASRI